MLFWLSCPRLALVVFFASSDDFEGLQRSLVGRV